MLQTAVVGVGFIGAEHIEAIRRTNLATVAAIVGRSPEQTEQKAKALGIPAFYTDYDAVLQDPSIQVIHICTPNHLHYAMARKALFAGKHVVCEKPMTMTRAEAEELLALARERGLVHAIHFNIRYYPLIRQAKEMIARGQIGRIYSVTGSYLQDWLIKDTDYSWRLESAQSGTTRAVGDIGTHWMDLIEYVTGDRITEVNADLATFLPVRKKPKKSVETWSGKILKNEDYDPVSIDTEDYASVLFHSAGGIRGVYTVNQMAAGHKNRVFFEVDGEKASLSWNSEVPNELQVGYRDKGNEVLIRDPSLAYPSAASIMTLPGGHNEGFADTSKQLFKEVYEYILQGDLSVAAPFPTFENGLYEAKLCDAIVKSCASRSWIAVDVPDAKNNC